MTTSSCCGEAPGAAKGPDPARRGSRLHALGRRCLGLVAWACPAVVLAFLPKCPLCFAGYVAVGTGIGLSAPVAGHLRTALMVTCIASLVFLVATRSPLRWLRRRIPSGARQRLAAR